LIPTSFLLIVEKRGRFIEVGEIRLLRLSLNHYIQDDHMNSIKILDPIVFEDQQIRRTADGGVAVFDLIGVVGGQINPRKDWERLSRRYPEVVAKCYNLKFPGRGQRETPVAPKNVALEILGLLPGTAGDKYRAEAAQLVLAWYEAPADLAIAAIDRIDNAADSKRVLEKAAEKYLTTYHPLFNELKERAKGDRWTYINVNTLNTKTVLGSPPKDVVLKRGGDNARSNLAAAEYGQFSTLQDVQVSALRKVDAHTKQEVYAVTKEVAQDFEDFLNKYR